MNRTFYIIDGLSQINRAFYAPGPDLSAPSGEPTKTTGIFLLMLLKLMRDHEPDHLAMVMDIGGHPVFRKKIYPEYKANRNPSPRDIQKQIWRIVSIMNGLGLRIYGKPGFEADDLMATMCERLKDEPVDVVLVGSDKDLHQLLSDRVRMFDPSKDREFGPEELEKRFGYAPAEVVDIQTLAGDSTDNIPGVRGIGVKTATKLVRKYGSAEAVVEHADELTPKAAQNVRAFADPLDTTRELVTLRRDVPFKFKLERCEVGRLRIEDVDDTLEELGLEQVRNGLLKFQAMRSGSAVQTTAIC